MTCCMHPIALPCEYLTSFILGETNHCTNAEEKRLTKLEKNAIARVTSEAKEDAKDAFRAAHIPMTSKDYIEIIIIG